MSFQISIPHRSADEPLSLVAAHARHLGQDEDRVATRQLVLSAYSDGVATTAGELIDHVASLEPHERRAMLDRARADCGLPSTAEVEAAQPRPLQVRTVARSAFPECAAEECTAAPTRNGIFWAPDCRKWWCDQHIDQAAPGDLEPRGSGLVLSPSGTVIELDPAADARDRAREESRRAQLKAQADDRRVEAAELRASKQASDAAHRQELPAHFRETP